MSETLQLYPAHADHMSYYKANYVANMLRDEFVIAQPKYDGERMLIHIDGENVYCTSRRFSKKTNRYMENQDKLPILKEVFKNWTLGYTVIDCECYSDDWSTVVGILHSLPERAIELQKKSIVKFAVFDCLYFDGVDIRNKQYLDRLKFTSEVINIANYENLHLVKFMTYDKDWKISDIEHSVCLGTKEDVERCMNLAIDNGFEGIVIKSLQRKYYDKGAIMKCKKFETVDVVVCGYKDGTGKYKDSVGALQVGYYVPTTGTFIKVSNVNCSTDEERELWNSNREKMIGTVIEIKCQEITDSSFRHPVYIRRREDKDYTMCTKDTIFKE